MRGVDEVCAVSLTSEVFDLRPTGSNLCRAPQLLLLARPIYFNLAAKMSGRPSTMSSRFAELNAEYRGRGSVKANNQGGRVNISRASADRAVNRARSQKILDRRRQAIST